MKYFLLFILYLPGYGMPDHSSLDASGKALQVDSCKIFVRVGNIIKDTATSSEILANGGLRTVLVGCEMDFHISILQFSVTLIDARGDTTAFSILTKGAQFS